MFKIGKFILIFSAFLIMWNCASDKPKNVIVMISDGCGYNQINAASIYEYGTTGSQIYEQFPVKYAVSTYSLNTGGYDPDSAWKSFDWVLRKPTDSAASATAMSTGIKTLNGRIAIDSAGIKLETVIDRLEKYGKSTGVITSVPLSHATPAGFAAHNISRGNYEEIGSEMANDSKLEVIMGCGNPYFDNDGKVATDTVYKYVGGKETWEKLINGTAVADCDGDGIEDIWTLIQDRSEFQKLMTGETPKRIFGVAQVEGTLQQGRSGDNEADPFAIPFTETVPTLAEMTKGALNVLDNDPDGFFIMIEGGAIDWACHANQIGREIEEEVGFNEAVKAVVDWIEQNSSWDETLLIITADHETGYLTGPGTNDSTLTADATIQEIWKPLKNNGKGKVPGVQWNSGGHTNSLIPLFAKGAGSSRFQNYEVGIDPVRGKYVDDTSIAEVIFSCYQKPEK
jgi:alkaline phosphatase